MRNRPSAFLFRLAFVGTIGLPVSLNWALADETARDGRGKPIPRSRPEMKQALERLKQAQPRLPLSPPSEQQRAAAGDRPLVNNGMARSQYLPPTWQTRRFDPDPAMTLDPVFKTRIFWIVSRSNNCHYCLGHQEHKLATAGQTDDQIAELDTNWADCPENERVAFALARKMTLESYAVIDADIDALRPFYTPAQIVELVYTIASYNSTNRWTDSLGLPQDYQMRGHAISFDTPTSARYQHAVEPMLPDQLPTPPPLESREEVNKQLARCRQRHPRVTLPDDSAVRQAVAAELGNEAVRQWMRPLALFPNTATSQLRFLKAIESDGQLSKPLKARLFWVAARHNRAWYALGQAERWLESLGESTDDLYTFEESPEAFSAAEQAALKFAARLTNQPQSIVDEDIAALRANYPDTEVAQIVNVVCVANMFDRLTETLALPLD